MDIKIDRAEALRYLGYRDQRIDGITDNLIEESIIEVKNNINTKSIYKEFEINVLEDKVIFKDSEFQLKGNSIVEHLKDSQACILLALTLGHSIDRLIRYYEKINMAKTIIIDACASATIEGFAENICEDLAKEYKERGKNLTSRFSPGYGDLNIGIQGDFLNLLDASRSIGITATSHNILIPRKSITAIVGVGNNKVDNDELRCKSCNKYPDCNFVKRGKEDGN